MKKPRQSTAQIFSQKADSLLHFVSMIDSSTKPNIFWPIVAVHLAELYALSLKLPNQGAGLNRARYKELRRKASEDLLYKLNAHQVKRLARPIASYKLIFDPLTDSDVIESDTALDLMEILQGLNMGLSMWNSNYPNARKFGAWHWRETFQLHLSWHALGLLRAIHFYTNLH